MRADSQNPRESLLSHSQSDMNQEIKLFDKRIWDIDDVVKATGYSKYYIYELVSKDRIPRLPKKSKRSKLLFDPEEILDWLHEGDF